MDKAQPFDANERPGISPAELALINAVLAENGSTDEARRAINHNFHQGIAPDALRKAVKAELGAQRAPVAATTTPQPKKNQEPVTTAAESEPAAKATVRKPEGKAHRGKEA